MKKRLVLFLLVTAALALTASGSTKLVFTWLNPDNPAQHFKNIMVLGINGKAAIRAEFEDQLCAGIARPGIQCVPPAILCSRGPKRRQSI